MEHQLGAELTLQLEGVHRPQPSAAGSSGRPPFLDEVGDQLTHRAAGMQPDLARGTAFFTAAKTRA